MSKAKSLNNPKKCVLRTTVKFPFLHSMTLPVCKKDSFFPVKSILNLSNHISLTSALCIQYYLFSQERNNARQPVTEDMHPSKILNCPTETLQVEEAKTWLNVLAFQMRICDCSGRLKSNSSSQCCHICTGVSPAVGLGGPVSSTARNQCSQVDFRVISPMS